MQVLFIATRDPRQRYRFLHDPLTSTDTAVFLHEDTGTLLPAIVRGARRLRLQPRPDVVILTGGDIRNFIWFILVALLTRARRVVRFGGDPLQVRDSAQSSFRARGQWLRYLRSRVGKALTRVMLKRADGIILVSEFLRRQLQPDLGLRVRSLVLAPTIPDPDAGNGNAGAASGRTMLLTVTNLNYREKADGVVRIVDALRELSANGRQLQFDVIGGGHHLDDLRQWLRQQPPLRGVEINLHGQLADLSGFYRRADIFVYCSTLDGYPLVLAEAQAYGLPVLVNRWGGFPDMLNEEKDALFYESDSIDELGAGLRRLLDDAALRARMGKAARENFTLNNSPQACARRLQQFLHSLI